jgi:transposase
MTKRYIGIDAHARTCTLGVISASGVRQQSYVVETNGQALVEAIRVIPGERHVCIEEGTQSAWLYELLKPHVAEIVVCVPEKASGAKDDKRDAFRRAELRAGSIKTRVYKAPQHLAELRCAERAYRFAVRDVVRAKNRLKSVFLSRGQSPDAGVYDPETRPRALKKLVQPYQKLAEGLGQQLDALMPARKEAESWLLETSKSHPIIRKLATAPGMGRIRTAQVVAVVGSAERFRTRRQFWSYSGLGIVTRSSSDWRPRKDGHLERVQNRSTRGLNRKCQPLLKSVFKGAATTVVTQLPKDPLHAHYQRMVKNGVDPALARLTLARRIAATVLSMWKHGEVYDQKRHATTDQQ